MELRQLRYFSAVATSLHYGRAAEQLCISQPALSQQIHLLEAELGVALFDRGKRTRLRKVELTAAGHAFLPEAQYILQRTQNAMAVARRVGSQQQEIEIGYYQMLLPARTAEIVQLFTEHFPGVRFHLRELPTFRAVQEALLNETLNLGLTLLPLLSPELTARTFHAGVLMVAMSQQHPRATASSVSLADLQHEQWVEITRTLHPVYDEIERMCQQAGFSRQANIVQEVSSLELLGSLVSLGIGIAFVPSFFDISRVPGIVTKPLLPHAIYPMVTLQQCVAYKSGKASPLVQALVALV